MDKLKQRAKEKGIKTSENVTYDNSSYDPNLKTEDDDFEALEINSPEDFFTMDVVMSLYNENGNLVQTSYFDKETIAMRTDSKVNPKPIYHDREGKFYAFNIEDNQYESMSILPPSSMGFMMAGMIPQFYKLPQNPYLQAFEALSKLDISISFYVMELSFIYKPEHFDNNDFYIKTEVNYNGGMCIKYSYNDKDYNGSYIVFDKEDRLREFYINAPNNQASNNNKNQTGKFIFSYNPVDVKLPDSVEQSLVPGPLGKIIPLEKGLEPWKHNKADKQKN
ncbi:hypothetical protein [Hyunsoonleella aestuarii]|uniref:DUF4412 domain-containing protein n=1 Tax=Hyunsoonleella aestuarii TaxID=912802 RepID=A0ABP8EBP9_9FLAO|nr:hypothetical protein [Hyunsoonleella aestuarii]